MWICFCNITVKPVATLTLGHSMLLILQTICANGERRYNKKILYNRKRLYSIGIILYKKLFLFSKKLIEFVHKGVNILELAINRRKTDI